MMSHPGFLAVIAGAIAQLSEDIEMLQFDTLTSSFITLNLLGGLVHVLCMFQCSCKGAICDYMGDQF